MGRYWVSFAETGDPNSEGSRPWPAYDPDADSFLELGDEIRSGQGVAVDRCAIFDRVAGASD